MMDESVAERLGAYLRRRRRELGRKLQDVARRSGLDYTHLSRIERGERGQRLSRETLERLARGYDVPVEQLDEIVRGGEVPPPVPRSYEEVLEQARMLAPVAIPVVEHPAHAGHHGSPVLDYVYLERPRAAGRELVCIPVEGDCMAPNIQAGDRVIVARDLWPQPGQVVVAVVDDEIMVRRFYERDGRIILRAANPAYPDIEATEVQIIGVVLEVRRVP